MRTPLITITQFHIALLLITRDIHFTFYCDERMQNLRLHKITIHSALKNTQSKPRNVSLQKLINHAVI